MHENFVKSRRRWYSWSYFGYGNQDIDKYIEIFHLDKFRRFWKLLNKSWVNQLSIISIGWLVPALAPFLQPAYRLVNLFILYFTS